MNKLCFTALLLMTSFIAHTQVILNGIVTDLENDEPLQGAFVSINSLELGTITDAEGYYTMVIPEITKDEKYVLTVNYLGFKNSNSILEVLKIDNGESIIQNVALETDPLNIKDIIITANRVEEELQDVPIAISVVNARNLEVRTASNTQEALEKVPNLLTDSYIPSQPTFSIRGLATNFNTAGVENSVGLYIDDVFYSRAYGFNSTLMDIERVEVLRGPQGTLFGKNTTGGVIHIITEEPKMGNSGAVELSAGNFNMLQVRAKANTQLVKNKLALRVTGAYKNRDGWLVDDNSDLSDENGINFFGTRASLLYKPNQKVKVLFKGQYSQDTQAEFTVDYMTPPSGIDLLEVPKDETDAFDRSINQDFAGINFDRKTLNAQGNIEIKLDDVHTLTSVTAYGETQTSFLRDFDATSVNAAVFGRDLDFRNISQELRISTPRTDRNFFYVAGLFYLSERSKFSNLLQANEGFIPIWRRLLRNPNLTIPNYSENSRTNSIGNSTSLAGYVNTTSKLGENVRLNAGLRYTYEYKDLDFWQIVESPFGIVQAAIAKPLGTEADPIKREVSDNAISGNFGLDFKTSDKTLLYINVSRGFKGSGFNVGVTNDPDPENAVFIFEPETVNSYEFGLKLRYQNRYLFNIAAFVADYKNKQESVAAGTSVYVSNAKASQGQGVEVEFVGIFEKWFKTDVSLGAMNLKYYDFPFLDPSDPTNQTITDLTGNRLYKAPNFTFQIAPEFNIPLSLDWKILARLDYNYTGKSYNDIFNTESLARQATGLLNARVSFASKDNKYALALWGKNLTDETYIQHGWNYVFGSQIAINPPRTLGVELLINLY